MKTLLILMTILFSIMQATAKQQKAPSKLSTDVRFDDRVVGGKYQYSTESVTTVENDKGIDDLIGVRKNFNDRIKRSESLR